MAITPTVYGSVTDKTAGSAIGFNTTATIPLGTLLVLVVTADNTSATAPTISSITSLGPTWVDRAGSVTQSGASATASTGVFVYCQTVLTTSTNTSGTNITVSFSSSPPVKAVLLVGFSEMTDTLRNTVASAASTSGLPSVATAGTALVAGDLVIGVIGQENSANSTVDTDTLNGSWVIAGSVASVGGSAATNCAAQIQYKIVTATGAQTFNPPGGANDAVAIVFAMVPAAAIAITQASYQFFADGTVNGATALAAENTAYTADVTAGNVSLAIRVSLQSTSTGTPLITDDWQLQWEKNANGTWNNITAASATVSGFDSANLTEGASTPTFRLTPGTGGYRAGKVSEDGVVDDFSWIPNKYTEVLYAVTLKSADLANSDTLRFRIVRNGATTEMTYTQTPTINVTKTAAATGQPKVYLSGAFTKKPLKVWSGSAWGTKPVKVWTGSTWKTLT